MPWGTHFCHFYETKQDLLDTLIPYFKAGLENKEFCLWVVSQPLTVEEAKHAMGQVVPDLDQHLAERSFEIHTHDEWYLHDGQFDPQRVIRGWHERLNEALARGYAGMRASANTAWIKKEHWRDFREYEKEVDALIRAQRMIILCTYPLTTSPGDQVFDVARIHQVAVARRHGSWEIFETPELKQAKAEIKRLNDELEQKVEERTRELATTNEALRSEIADRKRAEEALKNSYAQLRALSARLQSVREEEATRISREIHDDLGQKLTALKMDLGWSRRKLAHLPESPEVNPILNRISVMTALIDELVASVQEIATDLRPALLDELGLGAALQFEADRFQGRTGIECEVRLPENEMALPANVATALFRIFQECLTNVARHAQATKVEVEMRVEFHSIFLSVHDNGRGVPPAAILDTNSLGLLGMRERATLLGGEILIESHGDGTTVSARIPLPEMMPAAAPVV
jgi:signal transduction histidine kinase